MATVEERIRKLVDENLEIEGRPLGRSLDLNASLRDAGVPSADFVAFTKVVAEEFNLTFSPDDCSRFQSLGDLVTFLDSRG